MSLRDERIGSLSDGLAGIAQQYTALSQTAARDDASFTDFLEQCLKAEQRTRQARSRSVLVKMAGFPAI